MTFRSWPVRRAAVAVALAAGVIVAGPGLHAQGGPPSKAFDRLFSPDPPSERARVSLSIYEGLDTLKDSAEVRPPDVADGAFTGLNPTAAITKTGSHGLIVLSGGSTLRRYAGSSALALLSADGTVNAFYKGRRTGLRLRQTVGHAPYYDFLDMSRISIGPTDDADVPSPDRAAYDRPLTTYLSAVGIGYQLTRKLMFSGDYGLRYSSLAPPAHADDPVLRNPLEQSGSFRLRQQLDRYTVLVAGYGLRSMRGVDPATAPIHAHDLQLGVDRSQEFAVLRRAVLMFSGGSSIVSLPGEHRFVLTGAATFHYDLSRTWSMNVAATRDVGYLDALADPVISQDFLTSVGGFVGSRIELQGVGGYVTGDVGVGGSTPGFHAYSGSFRLRARIAPGVAAYGEWTQYEHVFGDAVALPDAFVRRRLRSGFRVGLVLSHAVRQPQERGEQ